MSFSSKVFELIHWAPAGYQIVASDRGLCRVNLYPELPEPWASRRDRVPDTRASAERVLADRVSEKREPGEKIISLPRELAAEGPECAVLDQAARELAEYFAGERDVFDVALDLEAESGGEFHRRVWRLLAKIPFAELTTYGALADELGVGRGASRAVGQAVGRNPLAVILPCHRVVSRTGRLTGFSAGLSLKVKLLEHEGIDLDRCGSLASHLVREFRPGRMRERVRSPYRQAALPLS